MLPRDCFAALTMKIPPGVIGRSAATKQARAWEALRAPDCFAALAMTIRWLRSAAAQQAQHAVELIQCRIMQGECAASPLRGEGDAQAKARAELAF